MEDRVKRPVIIIAAAAAFMTVAACSRQVPSSPAPVETISNHDTVAIEWESDMSSALERARSEGKPVLVNFYADWCVWCKRLESTTLRNAKVASVLQDKVVPLSLDVDGAGKELSNEYRVDGLPTILVLDVSGEEIGRIPGYMPPESFLEQVESFLQHS
jgi:thiol:disulfide interchange protein